MRHACLTENASLPAGARALLQNNNNNSGSLASPASLM